MSSEIKADKWSPASGTAGTIGDSGDTFTVPTGANFTVTDELKTNKISPASGTSFTMGDSGDTFTIPSGVTLANSGTATGFDGGLVPISLTTVSTTVNTIDISDCFTSTYRNYFVMGYNLRPGVDNVSGMLRFKSASGNESGSSYNYANTGQSNDSNADASYAENTSSIALTGNIDQHSNVGGFQFNAWFFTPQVSAIDSFDTRCYMNAQVSYRKNTQYRTVRNISAVLNDTDVITGLHFFTTGGTSYYDRGCIAVYGLKDS